MATEDRTIRLLSRQGCHLCEDAAEALGKIAGQVRAPLEIVDITGDPELERLYGDAIPVVLIGETEVDRAPLSPRSLAEKLNRLLG